MNCQNWICLGSQTELFFSLSLYASPPSLSELLIRFVNSQKSVATSCRYTLTTPPPTIYSSGFVLQRAAWDAVWVRVRVARVCANCCHSQCVALVCHCSARSHKYKYIFTHIRAYVCICTYITLYIGKYISCPNALLSLLSSCFKIWCYVPRYVCAIFLAIRLLTHTHSHAHRIY